VALSSSGYQTRIVVSLGKEDMDECDKGKEMNPME
jgi:hypothetical protein